MSFRRHLDENARKKEYNKNAPTDDALMMVVATPITFGDEDRVPLLRKVWAYLMMESVFMITWLWGKGVNHLDEDSWMFYVAIYVSVGNIAKWFYILYGEMLNGFQITEVDHNNVTVKEYRVNHKVKDVTDVPGLLGEENYNEAMEVIAFKWGDLGDAALQKYVECINCLCHRAVCLLLL